MCRVKLIGLLCSLSVLVASQASAAAVAAIHADSAPATIIHNDGRLVSVTEPSAMDEKAVRSPAGRADAEYWALMAGGFAATVMVMRRKKKPPSVTS